MRLIDADEYEKTIGSMIQPYGDGSYPGDEEKMFQAEVIVDCIQALKESPTIDPVHAAGGCYCRECQFAKPTKHDGYMLCTGYIHSNYVKPNGGCLEGEPKEAQDDSIGT